MENPQELLNLISNKNVSRILINAYKKPRSAQELTTLCSIPIAVCYRLIHRLEDLGFMTYIEKRHNRRGKPVKYYRSQINHAQFFYENGRFRAKIHMASRGWEYYPPADDDMESQGPMRLIG